MKKLFKSLLVSTLLVGSITLTGCSSFFGEDMTAYTIKEVTADNLENGDIQVTITYVNEEQEPLVFVVPHGEQGVEGQDGTGIKEIKVEKDENNIQTITIVYTDDKKEPVSYVVPAVITISDTTTEIDPDTGNVILTVHYSDGTTSKPITLPSGKNGVGITDIQSEIKTDNTTNIKVILTEGDPIEITLPAPAKGVDGRGIESIVSNPLGDDYVLTINYTDGTSEDFQFVRPNRWYSVAGEPNSMNGLDGDLWFDLNKSAIYIKEFGTWNLVISLKDEVSIFYTVTFDTNGGNMAADTPRTYSVESGKYFTSTGYNIPIPTKEGYEFVGWYTSKTVSQTTGYLTDLTPICSDLKLYAIWR